MWWGEADPGTRVTEGDRLIIQALAEYEQGLCQCGNHRLESQSNDHNPYNPQHTGVYKAGLPDRCYVCTELARAQRSHAKALGPENQDDLDGLSWPVVLMPRGGWVEQAQDSTGSGQ